MARALGLPLDCPTSGRRPANSGPLGSRFARGFSTPLGYSLGSSGLEIMCTREGTEGSNPSLSAKSLGEKARCQLPVSKISPKNIAGGPLIEQRDCPLASPKR
jgi:hypothetical protein